MERGGYKDTCLDPSVRFTCKFTIILRQFSLSFSLSLVREHSEDLITLTTSNKKTADAPTSRNSHAITRDLSRVRCTYIRKTLRELS